MLAKELSESRQTQVDVLHTQLQEVNAKLEAVWFLASSHGVGRHARVCSPKRAGPVRRRAVRHEDPADRLHAAPRGRRTFNPLPPRQVSQAQTVSATLKEVQRALDTERASSAEKASRLSHDLAVATAACHAAEASVAQQQQQLRDLTDRLAATQQDLETATRAVVDEKARSQLLAQEHARLESL